MMEEKSHSQDLPEVTRAELDDLRRELWAANERIAVLIEARDRVTTSRPGPVMTNVLAGFIVAGGIAMLAVASRLLQSNTPFAVWLVVGAATGVIYSQSYDRFVGRSPTKSRLVTYWAIVLGLGVVIGFLVLVPLSRTIENVTGAQLLMFAVSMAVGVPAHELLKSVGWLTWFKRLWRM